MFSVKFQVSFFNQKSSKTTVQVPIQRTRMDVSVSGLFHFNRWNDLNWRSTAKTCGHFMTSTFSVSR